jgi:hypothetical protein
LCNRMKITKPEHPSLIPAKQMLELAREYYHEDRTAEQYTEILAQFKAAKDQFKLLNNHITN